MGIHSVLEFELDFITFTRLVNRPETCLYTWLKVPTLRVGKVVYSSPLFHSLDLWRPRELHVHIQFFLENYHVQVEYGTWKNFANTWVICIGHQQTFLVTTKYVVKFLGLKVYYRIYDMCTCEQNKGSSAKDCIKVLSSTGTFNDKATWLLVGLV